MLELNTKARPSPRRMQETKPHLRNKLKNQTFLTTPSPSRDHCWPVVRRAAAIGSKRSGSPCYSPRIETRGGTRDYHGYYDGCSFHDPGPDPGPDHGHDHGPDLDHGRDPVLVPALARVPHSNVTYSEYFSVAVGPAESQPAVTAGAGAFAVVVVPAVVGSGGDVALVVVVVVVVVMFVC